MRLLPLLSFFHIPRFRREATQVFHIVALLLAVSCFLTTRPGLLSVSNIRLMAATQPSRTEARDALPQESHPAVQKPANAFRVVRP